MCTQRDCPTAQVMLQPVHLARSACAARFVDLRQMVDTPPRSSRDARDSRLGAAAGSLTWGFCRCNCDTRVSALQDWISPLHLLKLWNGSPTVPPGRLKQDSVANELIDNASGDIFLIAVVRQFDRWNNIARWPTRFIKVSGLDQVKCMLKCLNTLRRAVKMTDCW